MSYLAWFSFGVAVEWAVLQLVLRRPFFRTALYILLINGITHPITWWAVQSGQAGGLAAELTVTVAEVVLIAMAFEISARRALAWSCAANGVSAAAGLLVVSLQLIY